MKVQWQVISTKEGGRRTPTPSDFLSSQLYIGSDGFDCRLLLEHVGSIAPGQQAEVYIKFLNPTLIISDLAPGAKFVLREGGKRIGEGMVKQIPASGH